MSLSIDGKEYRSIHVVGVLGSGMSAIAQFARLSGMEVSGSDRLLDAGESRGTVRALSELGVLLRPQDGSAVSEKTGVVAVSTAIEETNADIAAARRRGVPVAHRSEVLAAFANTRRTIAVAGTSGKSTVAAMIFEFLDACGFSPSLITGAGINRLARKGYIGNAWVGGSDLLVIEADESDGSLVRYRPSLAVFLNVSKDHKPVDETLGLFSTLARQSEFVIVNADDKSLDILPRHRTFGIGTEGDYRLAVVERGSRYTAVSDGHAAYRLNMPGEHNAANLAAALCVCDRLGCDRKKLSEAVPAYEGISRRFAVVSTAGGVTVVDDYAHNPQKIRAALATARGLGKRLVAIFQPHGFGPTRFLRDELIEAFAESLTEDDIAVLLPIYYAGGTVDRSISSDELAREIAARGVRAYAPPGRAEALDMVKQFARPGDCVISMGARDPSLEEFAASIAALFHDV